MGEKVTMIGCLRKERVTVRHVPRMTDKITNPRHVLYGGMADSATRVFVVPKTPAGRYVDVLSDEEEAYLEEVMGLEPKAMSVYRKDNNFWDDDNPVGVSRVVLRKQDNFLDLSVPEDYIRYKILLANRDYVAPSLKALEDHPKATYQYVIVGSEDETNAARAVMSNTMRCYKEYGKVEDDRDVLMYLVETFSGRPVSWNTKLELLQVKINEYIQADTKRFLSIITDPLMRVKVLIRNGVKAGAISRKGDFYYLRSDGTPLCDEGQEPTLNIAAAYLSQPKRQQLRFTIETIIKEHKEK